MKFLKFLAVLAWGMGLGLNPRDGFAQKAEVDALLPPDHLLENLPWWTEGGEVEMKGLFSFEDLGAPGTKNLVFLYRPAAPVTELDKPHTQTLAVCVYNGVAKKYVKLFEDEGGPLQWIKTVKDPAGNRTYLMLLRSDLKGNQELKGFRVAQGKMEQVLEARAPQAFVNIREDSKGPEILCSAKNFPAGKSAAEHVFAWDDGVERFQDETVAANSPGNWSGFSILVPTPVVVAKKEETGLKTPAKKKVSIGQGVRWWEEPLNASAAFQQLKNELVPQSIGKKQIGKLGQMANAFFEEAKKKGVAGNEFLTMRAEYYAAVASALVDTGEKAQAKYYLGIASKILPTDPDVQAAKKKVGGVSPSSKAPVEKEEPEAAQPPVVPQPPDVGTPVPATTNP